MDEQVGRLLDRVDELGKTETIVVFHGDQCAFRPVLDMLGTTGQLPLLSLLKLICCVGLRQRLAPGRVSAASASALAQFR